MKHDNFGVGMGKGVLIVYEGISGSGKSEGIQHLLRNLDSEHHKTTVVEWNSNKAIRHIIFSLNKKKLLTPKIYSFFQWLGFIIDYLTKIVPLLNDDNIVIADRYVYTGLTRDVLNRAGQRVGQFLTRFVRKPDILFFYNTDPHICYERIVARGKRLFHTNKLIAQNRLLKNKDLYYLTKLKNEYIKLFTDTDISQNVNIVFICGDNAEVCDYVEKYLNLKFNTLNILKK